MSAQKPLASIITVCFNAAASIGQTLDSVRAQSWRPLESVVVDGASRDGTQDIVARYADITGTVVSEKDSGIYDAMNKGIALARGDVLHFLNAADCFADAGVVEAALREFAADPDLDLVFGDAIYLTPDGPFLRSYGRVTASNLIYGDLCHQAVFAHRRLFERFGGFNLDYRINADYDWMLRVFRGGARVRYLPRPIVRYDTGGQSARNQAQTFAERDRVRQTHVAPLRLAAGMKLYRLQRKLRTLAGSPELSPLDR
ncbi:MAG: glycosyltransferase [Hydrogenophilales bacterium]|nr:glycosyltransferase [Hydrogenophilales bacterium]